MTTKTREAVGTGIKRGGKVAWDDAPWFTDQLKLMQDGSVVVTVTLATPRAIRSIKLQQYYRGHVLHEIAAFNGDDPDVLHDQMCARFLSRTTQLVNRHTGEVEEIVIVGRTSTLDSEDFWDFILKVRLFAAEFFGVETRDPDPEWRAHRKEAVAPLEQPSA